VDSQRALLLERAATALAHEGKNPLHNMVLHLQLLDEKLHEKGQGVAPFERHLQALRDGIGRVDSLLKAFSDLASPWHLEADLGAAVSRAQLIFGHEARRGSVDVLQRGPASVPVQGEGGALCDLVCDGELRISIETDGPRARLELRAEGAAPRREEAVPHLEAVRRLSSEAGAELSLDAAAAGPARLSLSLAHPR